MIRTAHSGRPDFELPKDLSEGSESFSDEDLVHLAQAGDAWANQTIVERSQNWIRAKARSFFLVGGEHEDLVQEGLIGLFEAVRDFREASSCSFRSFAEICVRRQMITAIRAATRGKHTPLNNYVSLNNKFAVEINKIITTAEEMPASTRSDPLEVVLTIEEADELVSSLEDLLSNLESEVLFLHLEGNRYHEIATKLGCHVKAIDNALQRVKRKTQSALVAKAERDELACLI